jgi:LAS superfamily LD-carboxypeptidase LdcB
MNDLTQCEPANSENSGHLAAAALLFGEKEDGFVNALGGPCKVHAQVVPALEALQHDAKLAGFDLQIASGFRGFERQLSIWNAKALGSRPVLDLAGNPLDVHQMTEEELLFAILNWSALPGASRHHWGTDVDVYDAAAMPSNYQLQLTYEETLGEGVFARFHLWLSEYLKKVEQHFFRPYLKNVGGIAPEPWHLSYAPLADEFAKKLTVDMLVQKITSVDIQLKASILKHIDQIFAHYIEPYRSSTNLKGHDL